MLSIFESRLGTFGRLLALTLTIGFSALAAHGESCSCSSAYCSTSVSCTGACYAICGTTCSSGCNGGQGSGPLRNVPGSPLEWTGESISQSGQLSVDLVRAEPSDVSAELSRELGLDVRFITDEAVTLDIKGMPAVEILRELGYHGVVFIYRGLEDRSEERLRGLTTVFARGALAPRISEFLTQLLGRPVRFLPNSEQPLSIEAKDMPVHQLLEALATHGALKFD